MSTYEKYENTSKNYDLTRTAVGAGEIISMMRDHFGDLSKLSVLDAGCGTGNYALELSRHVDNIVCADISDGMLDVAREKLSKSSSCKWEVLKHDLADLPFQSESFDVIMANQCLHHVDGDGTHKNKKLFFNKAGDILKPNGKLYVNSISHNQLLDGVWWGRLIQPAVDRISPKFPSHEEFEELARDAGLVIEKKLIIANDIIQKKGYYDRKSLHSAKFRDGDSHFSLLKDEELSKTLDEIDNLISEGKFDAFLKEREAIRMNVGQYFIYQIGRRH